MALFRSECNDLQALHLLEGWKKIHLLALCSPPNWSVAISTSSAVMTLLQWLEHLPPCKRTTTFFSHLRLLSMLAKGMAKGSQEEVYSCVSAVLAPLQQTDCVWSGHPGACRELTKTTWSLFGVKPWVFSPCHALLCSHHFQKKQCSKQNLQPPLILSLIKKTPTTRRVSADWERGFFSLQKSHGFNLNL